MSVLCREYDFSYFQRDLFSLTPEMNFPSIPRTTDTSEVIPDALLRIRINVPPGDWVPYIRQLSYRRARTSSGPGVPKSELLQHLVAMPSVRKPILRPPRLRLAFGLEVVVTRSLSNIESAMMQIVGNGAPIACVSCRKDHGP